MKSEFIRYNALILILLLLFSCKTESSKIESDSQTSVAHQEEINQFRTELANYRKNEYLQLVGLLKMDRDTMVFGKSTSNSLFLDIEEIPDTIGVFIKSDSLYTFKTQSNIEITTAQDSVIDTIELNLDKFGSSVQLKHGRLKWQIISRNNIPYLRVWDTKNPPIETFKGFEFYPITSKMIFDGNFKYYDTSKSEMVESQLGPKARTEFIGQVSFEFNDETYTLDVGENGFTMVADETTGEETYGGGRYIYIDLPADDGKIKIDFNKLYNPPCSFNKYTTCLYPPQQNYLDFKLIAGEKIAQLE